MKDVGLKVLETGEFVMDTFYDTRPGKGMHISGWAPKIFQLQDWLSHLIWNYYRIGPDISLAGPDNLILHKCKKLCEGLCGGARLYAMGVV